MAAFWYIAASILVEADGHFRGGHFLHHQGTRLQWATLQKAVIFCNSLLQTGYLYTERGRFDTELRDRTVTTQDYRQLIMQQRIIWGKCRKCDQVLETIKHATVGFTFLAPTNHKRRQNKVAGTLHQEITEKGGLERHRALYQSKH
jgi:hypothetical protein